MKRPEERREMPGPRDRILAEYPLNTIMMMMLKIILMAMMIMIMIIKVMAIIDIMRPKPSRVLNTSDD